jgi:hypothetical protein
MKKWIQFIKIRFNINSQLNVSVVTYFEYIC